MAGTKRTRAELEAIFITGAAPTEGNFEDLIASNLSLTDADISGLTEKVTPHNDDTLLIEDSEDSNAKKKVKVSSLGGGGGSGESNTLALNGSATGTSIVSSKSGTTLQVKGLKSSTSKITIGIDGEDVDLGVSLAAADVSLGSVTDDSQLKRAAADFQSFTQKTGVTSSDVVLIEDVAASDAKKYATLSDLPFSSKYPTIVQQAIAFTPTATNHNTIYECSGTWTITLNDVTTVGVGFLVKNVSTGTITLSASGTLQHTGTKLKNKDDAVFVYHQGSGNWGAIGKLGT